MADKYNLEYLEVSAKSSVNIDEIFYKLAKAIKNQMEAKNKCDFDSMSRTIALNSTEQGKAGSAKEE